MSRWKCASLWARFPWLLCYAWLLCSGVSLAAQAATGAVSAVSAAEPTAASVTQRVDAHYDHLRSLRARFTEQYTGMGMERDEAGTLLLERASVTGAGRMRWDYSEPAGKYFLIDGRYAYFYAPGDEQVVRMKASELDDLRSPLRFLLGHTKFSSELTGLRMTAAGADFVLTGVPRGAEKRVAEVALRVTAAGEIRSMTIRELDGSVTRFRLSDEVDDPAIASASFRFHAPEGVAVTDGLPPA